MELGEIPGALPGQTPLLKLCILYYMAGEPERGLVVLERIVHDFPGREAARRARWRGGRPHSTMVNVVRFAGDPLAPNHSAS